MRTQETKKLLLSKYPIFYLNENEQLNPLLAINDFFSFEHLPQIRELLWLYYKMLVSGNYVQSDSLILRERYDLALLYEYLLKLIEEAHLLK